MKNILIGICLIGLFASCSSNTNSTEKDQLDEKTTEPKAKEQVTFTSWDLLTKYGEDPEGFLGSLNGKIVTITNIVFESGSYGYFVGKSYNGSQIMGYSRPDEGYSIVVDGMEMPEYKGDTYYLDVYETLGDDSQELITYDLTYDKNSDGGEDRTTTYHTLLSIEVFGDSIQINNNTSLLITGGKVVDHRNM